MIARYERYDIVYKRVAGGWELDKYVIHEGNSLYDVKAGYTKNRPANSYYIIAKNAKEAKKLFLSYFPWLPIVESVRECSQEEKDFLLNDYADHPRIIN